MFRDCSYCELDRAVNIRDGYFFFIVKQNNPEGRLKVQVASKHLHTFLTQLFVH